MKIDEKTFKDMPSELQELFEKLPNPGSDDVLSMFPVTKSHASNPAGIVKTSEFRFMTNNKQGQVNVPETKGSAARFFYCTKSSKRERNDGCLEKTYVLNDDCPLDVQKEIESVLKS